MLKNKLFLTIQYVDTYLQKKLPRTQIRYWVQTALLASAKLTIRFVHKSESQNLNRIYRNKNYATNVLTFIYVENKNNTMIQSDIVLCSEILMQEAYEQNKFLLDHTAHIIVHGVLHAQGYNHEKDFEAMQMETLEKTILARLGFNNPYIKQN